MKTEDWLLLNPKRLSSEKYLSFTEYFLIGKRKKNKGELTVYFIENDHEAIVNRETFEAV